MDGNARYPIPEIPERRLKIPVLGDRYLRFLAYIAVAVAVGGVVSRFSGIAGVAVGGFLGLAGFAMAVLRLGDIYLDDYIYFTIQGGRASRLEGKSSYKFMRVSNILSTEDIFRAPEGREPFTIAEGRGYYSAVVEVDFPVISGMEPDLRTRYFNSVSTLLSSLDRNLVLSVYMVPRRLDISALENGLYDKKEQYLVMLKNDMINFMESFRNYRGYVGYMVFTVSGGVFGRSENLAEKRVKAYNFLLREVGKAMSSLDLGGSFPRVLDRDGLKAFYESFYKEGVSP